MATEEKIQRNKISTADIPELMQWLLSSNPEEAKALQNSLNAEAPLKDWSRERLRELENQQPLDSNLICAWRPYGKCAEIMELKS